MESQRQPSDHNIRSNGRTLDPVRNRVVVTIVDEPQSKVLWTPSERARFGDVVAIGKPRLSPRHVEIAQAIAVGDRVTFPPHIGVEIIWDGRPGLIMREDEVLGVVDP